VGVRAKTIIDGLLYMGSTPAKWSPREERDRWLSENVDHLVVLCNREPEVDLPDVEVLHMPLVDSHKTVDPRIPQVVVPNVVGWLTQGEPTLVTCLAGRSRSGITCGLALRELYDLTGEEALEKLRAGRPRAIKREGPEAWFKALPRPSEDAYPAPEFGPRPGESREPLDIG
jgi:hypothetical protein